VPLKWNNLGTPPLPEQLEVSIFGPGYGESIVIHIGSGRWVIVDSCIDTVSGRPAPIAYLNACGVDVANAVDVVVATHWHDDHIRGMAQVVNACRSAKFCSASTLQAPEFLATVLPYASRNKIAEGPGVRELFEIIHILENNKRPITRAIADRRIKVWSHGTLAHGQPVALWTLTPSDLQYAKFLTELTALMPGVGETKRRAVPQRPNHVSVVVWIEIGDLHVLLGADLENTTNPGIGWSAVISSTGRPTGRATVFKIPHHGSKNAHHDQVWRTMLVDKPFAVLTPNNRGRALPTEADVTRITGLTQTSYSTAKVSQRLRKRRDRAVEKTVRDMGVKLRSAEPEVGLVRLRQHNSAWTTELFNEACLLKEIYPSV